MTTYVALVAIGNILIGLLLGQMLPPLAILHGRQLEPSEPSPGDRPKAGPMSVTTAAREAPASSVAATTEPVDREPSRPNEEETSAATKSRRGPATAVKSWDEFAHQLRELKERTRFCRPAQNMNLARQAAEQLQACAQVWYSQFEPLLLGAEMDESAKKLIAGADVGDVEMFAAQIETSLTNVKAIDWQGKVDDVLDCLERELELLDAQQRKVAKNVKSSA